MITKEMYLLAKKVVQMYERKCLTNPLHIDTSLFKTRRMDMNLSMQDVKDKTGISKSTISRIERGSDAFFETVVKLNDFYTKNQ